MKKLAFLLLLLVAGNAHAEYIVRINTVGDGGGWVCPPGLGCEFQVIDAIRDWSSTNSTLTGTWAFDAGFSSGSEDLAANAGGFYGGYIYVYTFFCTEDSGYSVAFVGTEAIPQPPEPTLWDWWVAGWNMALAFCGFGLLLRVVKGLRGPGSGEL